VNVAVTPRKRCRGCSSLDLTQVFALGDMPLVNALVDDAEAAREAPRYPLALQFCGDCRLVQLTHDVSPDILFSHYSYFSSVSSTMLRHCERLVADIVSERQLCPRDSIVEIASNDGYLLGFYARRGIGVLGIEPASNVAEVAVAKGIPTLNRFFDATLARELVGAGKRADVLHAHNTLAHVPDLAGFIEGLRTLLAPRGTICIEVPHVLAMVETGAFDTIYHEHFSYFSLTTLVRLFARQGLTITRASSVDIHGGSLRVFASHSCEAPRIESSVAALLDEERRSGVHEAETYRALGARSDQLRASLASLVAEARAKGLTIAAYGASAKGCVTQNYAALSSRDISFVVDKSPHKQGRFVPGTGQPIVSPTLLAERMPDLTLLTVWNLREEVLTQEREYLARGGRFIVPVPTVEVLQ
jgi:2-polyprenyl-3-methyl-5-hydroxy-6-metoxy-1,4-benzoquinol methylase